MRVIELKAENVKRLRAIEITPDQHVQIIGGRNAQGKTSVLDSIWLALGGGTASKSIVRPIRDGEKKASVRLDLGDLVVTRSWTGDKTALKVESKEGASFSSPQKVLDSLIGRLSFDPLEFTRLSAREQLAALLDLVDLDVDLDALAAERKKAFDDRTEIGRRGRALDGQAQGLGVREDAPDVEVSVSALAAEVHAARVAHRQHDITAARVAALIEDAEDQRERLTNAKANLAALESDLAQGRADLEAEGDLPDLDDIDARLEGAEGVNAAVRRNVQRDLAEDALTKTRAEHVAATATIERIDQAKEGALAKATFPVDGLGFTDDGVTYLGVPFAQASASEQIRVSLAMAMSLNPKLRVIRILDGSLLDDENLALIASMAKDRDFQVWVERVGSADGIGVVIEDGEIVA